MKTQEWRVITFSGDEPLWSRFDGERLIPDGPEAARRDGGPVIAVLPDDFFFFTLVTAPRTMREHKVHGALRLKMRHSFPPAVPGLEQGSFRLTPTDIVGYSAHPALQDFTAAHRALLDSADVVTSSFIIAFLAARIRNLGPWVWENGNGPGALINQEELHFFRSGGDEFEKRKALLQIDQEPERLGLENSLAALHKQGLRPAKMRLPLQSLQSSREFEPKFWSRVIAAVVMAGLLFSAGEFFRMRSLQKNAQVYETAIQDLYTGVLGENPGPDPFGTLLFRVEQRRGGGRDGVDVLGLLAVLSQDAPEGFTLEGVNFNGESGSIRALIDSYDQLDAMLERLGQSPDYAFSLEQASNTKQGVLMNLNFVKQE